jgi:RNA polymerase sigma-70 factor (ECF subfamily)
MNYRDDSELIESLRSGEEKAFVYLVDQYNQRLYGYALTLTKDHTEAEDILQNVFLRAWEKRKKMNITNSLQNYLYKSVRNEFLNQYKKTRSTMILEQKYFEALEKVTSTQDENEFQITLARITKEIQNLPPKCREVFIMSRKEGLTNLEISEYLYISVKTVEAQITKAFSVLKKELDEKCITVYFMLMGKVC